MDMQYTAEQRAANWMVAWDAFQDCNNDALEAVAIHCWGCPASKLMTYRWTSDRAFEEVEHFVAWVHRVQDLTDSNTYRCLRAEYLEFLTRVDRDRAGWRSRTTQDVDEEVRRAFTHLGGKGTMTATDWIETLSELHRAAAERWTDWATD